MKKENAMQNGVIIFVGAVVLLFGVYSLKTFYFDPKSDDISDRTIFTNEGGIWINGSCQK